MVSYSTDLPTHVAMKYGRSNMANKWQKQSFLILTMNYGLFVEVAQILNCNKTLHMQGYKVGHSAGLPTHVAIKYGGSNMADNRKSGAFGILTINYGLFMKLPKSVTAV